MTWMTVEMKSRMRGTAPIRTSNTHCSIHHIATGSIDETKGISNKCWICNTQTHWTDECQRFLAQNHENRLKIAQENHVCYSYLKRAGRDHKLSTVSRRKQCTEKENGIQCSQYHGNTSQYHGNILLDSGGQTSVICIEPAENLPLEGKRVFIKLTRGGGEEEEMTTKAYKV